MDKAPDFGSGDCRFESCHGRNPFLRMNFFELFFLQAPEKCKITQQGFLLVCMVVWSTVLQHILQHNRHSELYNPLSGAVWPYGYWHQTSDLRVAGSSQFLSEMAIFWKCLQPLTVFDTFTLLSCTYLLNKYVNTEIAETFRFKQFEIVWN